MVELIKSEKNLKLDSKLLVRAIIRLVKQDISERFKQTKKITNEDWEFCEQIDWHPVDELHPKKRHMEELKKTLKEVPVKFNSVNELFESK